MKRFLRSLLLMAMVLSLGLTMIACSAEKDVVGATNDGGEEDHHHDIPYEWSGIFQFAEGDHTVKFNKNDGDESILLAFISTAGTIADMEHHAAHVMESEAVDVEKDGSFTAENEYTYKLDLENETAEFKFTVKTPGEYYLFTEHLPAEFDMEILSPEGEILEADSPTEYDGDHEH